MPLATLPFPAELGVLGPFTRESLTGEKDPAGPYKDQAEIVWVELLLRFWQGQADRVVERVKELGLAPPSVSGDSPLALVEMPALFSEATKASTGDPIADALAGLSPEKIGGMTGKQAKDLCWRVLQIGKKIGKPSTYDRGKVYSLNTEEARALLFYSHAAYSPTPYKVTEELKKIALGQVKPTPKPKVTDVMGSVQQSEKQLLATIGPQLQKDVYQGSTLLYKQFEQAGVMMDWTLINTEAATWARKYAGLLVKGIDDTTRAAVGEAVGSWIETPGQTYGDLRSKLMEMAYPERRAKLIARTEVTRAYAQGSMITAANGEKWKTFPDFRPLFRYFKIWQTKNDYVVCEGCAPMHLEEVEGTKAEFMTPAGVVDAPPLHPGCRCWVTFRPEAITKEEAKELFKEAKAKKKEEKLLAKQKAEARAKKQKEERLKKLQQQLKEKEAAEKAKAEAEKAKEKAAAMQAAAEKKKLADLQKDPLKWRPGDPFVEPVATQEDLTYKKIKFTNEAQFKEYYEGMTLNGVPLEEFRADSGIWATFPDKALGEPPIPPGTFSSGVVMVEPDGRIWVVEPTKHYGGYNYTYPKGSLRTAGLTAQQNALKEVWEESGLLPEIDSLLGDYVSEQTGNTTRYYLGRRVGGAPWAFQKESQAVYLATLEEAGGMLHTWRDLDVLARTRQLLGVGELVEEAVTAAPMISRAIEIPGQALAELEAGIFPGEIEGLQNVRSLGGTTGAQLVKDPSTGRLYVLKRGASAGHIRSEALADELYRRAGAKVPAYRLYETASGPVKLAEYIPDTKSLSEVLSSGTAAAKKKALDQLQEHFVTDAWLGNWDVVGTSYDNILIDKSGTVWRIDNGGALLYRAQGNLKDGGLDKWLTELWSMRTDRAREQAYRSFGSLKWDQVTVQLGRLGGLPQAELLAGVEGELLPLLEARLGMVRDLWQTSTRLLGDKWVVQYVDDFARASVELRKAGLLAKLPNELKHRGGEGTALYDKQGRKWDALRGTDSASSWIRRYINDNGGDFQIIQEWASGQGGSAWSEQSQAIKYWIAQQRGAPKDYFWKEGAGSAQGHWDKIVRRYGEAKANQTLKMWHAFNYEMLRNTPMPNNDLAGGFLKIMRTEPSSVISRHKVRKGTYTTMPRGACESSSIYQTVCVAGNDLTLQVVPHHRVFGTYLTDRPGSHTMFYGDRENEVAFIPEGLTFYYWGSVSSGQASGGFWTDTILNRLIAEVFK